MATMPVIDELDRCKIALQYLAERQSDRLTIVLELLVERLEDAIGQAHAQLRQCTCAVSAPPQATRGSGRRGVLTCLPGSRRTPPLRLPSPPRLWTTQRRACARTPHPAPPAPNAGIEGRRQPTMVACRSPAVTPSVPPQPLGGAAPPPRPSVRKAKTRRPLPHARPSCPARVPGALQAPPVPRHVDVFLVLGYIQNTRILLANLLQSSRSTFSRGSLLSFFAFKAGILGAPISVLEGWPTVSARYSCTSLAEASERDRFIG